MSNLNFIAVDFETATNDMQLPCQVGIVIVKDSQIVGESSHLIQPPGNKYDSMCTRVHGINEQDTQDAKSFDELWPDLEPILSNSIVLAHNMPFDRAVLNKVLEFYNIDPPRIIWEDTMDIIAYPLHLAAKAFEVEIDMHHNALCDARTAAQIYIKYWRDKFRVSPSVIKQLDEEHEAYKETRRSGSFAPRGHAKIDGDVLKQDLSRANENNPFYDKKVVISGTYETWPDRRDLAALLKLNGADINTSISVKTDYLIAGTNVGPAKYKSAEAKGVQIINEKELLDLIQSSDGWITE